MFCSCDSRLAGGRGEGWDARVQPLGRYRVAHFVVGVHLGHRILRGVRLAARSTMDRGAQIGRTAAGAVPGRRDDRHRSFSGMRAPRSRPIGAASRSSDDSGTPRSRRLPTTRCTPQSSGRPRYLRQARGEVAPVHQTADDNYIAWPPFMWLELMNDRRITPSRTNDHHADTVAILVPGSPDAALPRGEPGTDGRRPTCRPLFPTFATIKAALLTLGALLTLATPAHAANYQDLKSVRYGSCLYAYGDPLEDTYLKRCSTTPAEYGNWAITNVGYYNDHPLWIIQRQSGSCLGVLGNAANNYLYSSCTPTRSKDVWEVFSTGAGRRVLKSFGAYWSWGQHRCLTFAGPGGGGRPQLGSCSLTSTTDQIYR
jgi:hypothetical protein